MPQTFKELGEQEVNTLVNRAKAESSTYGEAKKYLQKLDWETRDPIELLIVKEAQKKLMAETDLIKIGG